MTTINQSWRLVGRPTERLTEDHFEWREEPLSELGDGQILARTLYLSLDPTNRSWANKAATYLPAIPLGNIMRGIALSVVEASNNPKFAVGDHIMGASGWQTHYMGDGRGMQKLQPIPGMDMTAYFGLLGMVGLTAYFGLLDVADPQPGETVVVSGAAGAVGSLVGQIAKIKGCRVVGIAGTDEKIDWIVNELGFDAGINYKTEHVYKGLKKHCPDGIDVYFENVGGKILDYVLAQINQNARISLCGMIAQYNSPKPLPTYNLVNLLVKRAKIEGFIVLDYYPRAMEAITQLSQWYAEGKIQYRVQLEEGGLERAPEVLNMLFDGGNRGKLALRVS